MSTTRATVIGLIAIVLWSLLAVLTTLSGTMPPFQLAAICFSVGSVIGFGYMIVRGTGFGALKQPIKIWLLGVGGIFGYHFFYFTALRNAPPVEAGLIAYLWPLLIILFSALLPGERLKWHHILGGCIGFAGAYLIVSKGQISSFDPQYSWGFMSAGLCALIWSSYSVIMRFFSQIPTETVSGFCAVSAALALVCHHYTEITIWPNSAAEWIAVFALALGPVGLAFYVWDIGVKQGNIQILGAFSYAAPVLSTIALVAAGYASLSWTLVVATLLVSLGALIAAKDMVFNR